MLGWGGIENYYAAVPKNSAYMERVLDNHTRRVETIKRERRVVRDERRNTLREIAEMEKEGGMQLGSEDEGAG